MGRRRLVPAAALALLLAVSGAAPAGAATSTLLDPAVDRVVILSLPGVGWSAIDPVRTPNLWRLARGSATGNLTARTLGRSDPGSGYLTMGAGTRAAAPRTPLDGAGMEPAERFGDVTARDAFALNTGLEVVTGVVQVGIEAILASNAEEQIDVAVGALGDRLERTGHQRAVIANADGRYPDQPESIRRYAVNALMGSDGVVPAGRAGGELLQRDPVAPFGVRYDNDAVLDAFRDVWMPGAVVLVEGSDLLRADAFGMLATPDQGSAATRRALRHTDALVGRVLDEVDLARDAVVVVSPTRARGTVLSAVAVHAPGVPRGLLSSASTRRRGFVLLADVAPTILGLVGVPRDRDMTGSRFNVGRALPLTTRLDRLQDSSSAAIFRDRLRTPVTLAFAALLALLLGIGAWLLAQGSRARRRSAIVLVGLVVLSYLPAVYLARLLPLHEHGTPLYWTFIAATSIVLAFVARAVGRRRPDDALLAVLGVIVGVLVLDVMTGARLQLSSAFGYTATIGIRVSGFGNIAYAALGASAIVVSGLVAHRLGGRRGAVVASLVMIVALLADVAPFWGSDVGGVVSLVPAFGVTAAMLFRLRVRLTWRLVAIVTVGSAAALALLTGFDLARPADARTHLGRLAQQVLDQGFSPLANTITRKVDANLDTWSSSDWRLILLPSVLFLGYLAVFERGRVRALVSAVPETRAVLAGIGVLAVLGYAFNDSGVTVPAVVLAVTSVSLVVLLAVHGGDQPTRAPEWLVRRRVRVTPAPLR